MHIQLGQHDTFIDRYDAFKLETMAQAVLQNRPSFRAIRGRSGGQDVSIYTRHNRPQQLEELVIKRGEVSFQLNARNDRDKQALERIIRDTRTS